MSSVSKGLDKVEVAVRWDPSAAGAVTHDLDVIAATYTGSGGSGTPEYVVHHGSRSPDGTINLNRDSRTGQGLGFDEVMVLELDRLAERFTAVVVGVAIQQGEGRVTFGEVARAGYRIREGYTVLAEGEFTDVGTSTAATLARFSRDEHGQWRIQDGLHGFDGDEVDFVSAMGDARG
ncbi:TerD family protein [Streptomyces sp. NA04227]|uniref:TerD family protein n=1 Tax=Streptomyces sp. NA04227 TaxID=2742136 RepID=UPI001592780A|nr:TerD family protein [Streptomyces sp. NA04227]QKW07552.1 TerD family protein [Streptomyces sp. NA04227]